MTETPVPDATAAASAPPRTVYLHIGTFKSGTSYIQSLLLRNRDALAASGVLFPTGDRRWGAQARGVRDVLGIKGLTSSAGAWDELVAQIQAAPEPAAVISMEFLSLASEQKIRRIVEDLQPANVEVILGARDLIRVLPSAWQSMVKQGHEWPLDEFLISVAAAEPADSEPHRRFWHHHDLERIADTWGAVVGMERVHILTVPPSGAAPTVLWERFCAAIGADVTDHDTEQDQKSNFSLTLSDTELMRRVNLRLRAEMDRATFKRWATRVFANKILRVATSEEAAADRPRLSADTYAWAIERSRSMVDGLRARNLDVIGDLDDLLPKPSADAAAHHEVDPKIHYPDEAVEIIVKLIKRLAELDPEATGEQTARGRAGGTDDAATRRTKRRRKRRVAADESTDERTDPAGADRHDLDDEDWDE